MKPTIICENFDPPPNLTHFMKEAIGEVLKICPYDSYIEARVRKDTSDYLMTILINYPEGKFNTAVRDTDLRRVITQGMADIFAQVRTWWKFRFGKTHDEKTDWGGGRALDLPSAFPMQYEIAAFRLQKPLRVLIVDDDLESVTPLELCLEKLGCSSFVVNNGFEAIHEIVSGDRIYDVVILDWNMPEMNGGQALLNAQKVIAQAPSSNEHWENDKLSVITYSSRSRDEVDLSDCKDFHHLDHWEKPSSFLHLLNQASEAFAKLGTEFD